MFTALTDRLRRITSSSLFIPEIDGLRFIAIALVVLFHTNIFVISKAALTLSTNTLHSLFYTFLSNGSRGVQLFFVISGFILALPFAKKFTAGERKVDLKAYFLRRLTRLEPPYIVTMLACFVLLVVTSRYASHEILPSLGASLLYLHNVLPAGPSVNGVAWSLEIEVQFYILAPLLATVFLLKENMRRIVLLFTIIGLLIVQHFFPPHFETLYAYLQYFLIGFFLVDLYINNIRLTLSRSTSILFGCVSLLFIFFTPITFFANECIFLLSIFCFYFLALTDPFWKKIMSTTWLTLIGGMCYSIYLWHYIIISGIGNKSVGLLSFSNYYLTLFVQGLILIPCILLFSTIFYLLIERPCMDKHWPQKLFAFVKGKIQHNR